MPKKTEVTSAPIINNKINTERIKNLANISSIVLKRISTTQVLVFLLVVASFLIGVLITKVQYLEKGQAANQAATTPSNNQQAQAQAPAPTKADISTIKKLFDNKNLITFGDANRKNLFVEVADPSCPYCHAAAGLNGELNKQMGSQFTLVADGGSYVAPVAEMRKLVDQGDASFVYIYFPGHGSGEMAMKALYCANEQDKFWQAHDKLMTNAGYNLINNDVKNDKANTGKLVNFLADTVDSQALTSCLNSGKYDSYLTSDQQLASTTLSVNGTPGFFINDSAFTGAYSWNDMKSAVK